MRIDEVRMMYPHKSVGLQCLFYFFKRTADDEFSTVGQVKMRVTGIGHAADDLTCFTGHKRWKVTSK